MDDLTELYQEIILNHNRNPRHHEVLDPCTHRASGFNPLCGDKLLVTLRKPGDILEEVACETEGCAISRASGSIMTSMISGKSEAEAAELIRKVSRLLTDEEEPDVDLATEGDLAALIGVRRFPARVKCATLAWHALESAIRGHDGEASTE